MKNKVVIIGCGNVGMSYAYSLLNQKTSVNELILVDINKEKTIGEVMDLNHGLPFGPSKIDIKAGSYSDSYDAKIVMIAAGRNQDVGETRMDLIDKNKVVFKDIIKKVVDSGFKGIFIIATNPVDIMTYITWKYSKFPKERVIGTGTTLDSARLRYEIGNKLNLNPKNVHAYVIGEHGDTEFVPWTNATIGLSNINDFINKKDKEKLEDKVRNMAYDIIKKKGNTSYGIGMVTTRITNAILNNENAILTVSSYDSKNKLFIGYPTIVNIKGAVRWFPFPLSKDEQNKYNHSIKTLKQVIQKIEEEMKKKNN